MNIEYGRRLTVVFFFTLMLAGCVLSGWFGPIMYKEGTTLSRTAINDKGEIIIASWSYNRITSSYEITINQKTNNVWQGAFVASIGRNVYDPKIALNNNGHAIITWEKWGSSGESDSIVVKEFKSGTWQNTFEIETDDTENQLALNDDGYAIIVWVDDLGVKALEYIDDQWVNSTITEVSNAEFPIVAVNQSGQAVVGWQQDDFYELNIATAFAAVRTEGQWREPVNIGNEMRSWTVYEIGIDENGDIVAVWEDYPGFGERRVVTNQYRNGVWLGYSIRSSENLRSRSPNLSVNGNGDAILTWQTWNEDTGYSVYIQELSDGSWLEPIQFAPGYRSSIGIDENGDIVVIWEEDLSTYRSLYRAQRINGEWLEPKIVGESDNQLNGFRHKLDINKYGDINLVWAQSDDGEWNSWRSNYVHKR